MAEKKEDDIKVNIYFEKPGDPVKPCMVTALSPVDDKDELKEKAAAEMTKDRRQDAINEATQNDKSGEAG